jgi:hypothetical protein
MVKFVPPRKPKYQRKLSAKEMFVDLANTELRAQADPYIRGNPIRRLAWDVFERGGDVPVVGRKQANRGIFPKKWGGESQIVAQVLQTEDKTGRKAEVVGKILGTFTPPKHRHKDKFQRSSLPGIKRGGVKPDYEKANVQYTTGGSKKYPPGQDVAVLGHELGHMGSWYTKQKGKVKYTPIPESPDVSLKTPTPKFISEIDKYIKGIELFELMKEGPTSYSDLLIQEKSNKARDTYKAMGVYKSKHDVPDVVKSKHKEISAAATELLIDRGVPPERQYKRTTPGYFKLPFTGS